MGSKPANEFYDLERLSDWLISLLCMGMVITAVGMVSTVFELRLFDAIEQGNFSSDEEMMAAAESNDERTLALAVLEFSWFLITGTLTLIWIYRSAHNTGVHARHMEYSPGSCVWWYFIPIAYLWKPYGAMKEIWSESASQAGQPIDAHRGLLGAWWALWLGMNLAYNAHLRLSLRANELPDYRLADHVLLFGSALDIAATLALIAMIQRLSALQNHVRENPPAVATGVPGANW